VHFAAVAEVQAELLDLLEQSFRGLKSQGEVLQLARADVAPQLEFVAFVQAEDGVASRAG